MRIVPLVLLLALAPATACAGEVYRWVAADGTVHYTDAPPPHSLDYERIDSGDCATQGCLQRQARDRAEARTRQKEIREWLDQRVASGESYRYDVLANDGTVIARMKKRHVLQAWGEPDEVTRTATKHGATERWVYRDEHAYVYFGADGLVDRVKR
jgi:hypothetical protein